MRVARTMPAARALSDERTSPLRTMRLPHHNLEETQMKEAKAADGGTPSWDFLSNSPATAAALAVSQPFLVSAQNVASAEARPLASAPTSTIRRRSTPVSTNNERSKQQAAAAALRYASLAN